MSNNAQSGSAVVAEAQRLIAQIDAAVEQEAADGAARLRGAAPAGGMAPRRAHQLI